MTEAGDDSCLVRFSKFLLIFINVLFFLIGIGLITCGALALTNLNTLFAVQDQQILNTAAIWAIIIFGVVVLFTAIAGCCGAMQGGEKCGKCFLTIYSIIIFLVMLAEIGVGITVLLLAGKLGALGDELDKNKDVNNVKDEVEKQIITYASKLYTTCCAPSNSTDFACDTFKTAYATDNPSKSDLCASYDPSKQPEDQPGFVDFVQAIVAWLKGYVNPAGIACIVLAVIELLMLIASCHVMCHAKSASSKANEMTVNAGQPYAGNQAQTNNLAYGSPETMGQMA
jgi:hypothetical protein